VQHGLHCPCLPKPYPSSGFLLYYLYYFSVSLDDKEVRNFALGPRNAGGIIMGSFRPCRHKTGLSSSAFSFSQPAVRRPDQNHSFCSGRPRRQQTWSPHTISYDIMRLCFGALTLFSPIGFMFAMTRYWVIAAPLAAKRGHQFKLQLIYYKRGLSYSAPCHIQNDLQQWCVCRPPMPSPQTSPSLN
jgi:hypothetical protein